jgi:hypothetical protein
VPPGFIEERRANHGRLHERTPTYRSYP